MKQNHASLLGKHTSTNVLHAEDICALCEGTYVLHFFRKHQSTIALHGEAHMCFTFKGSTNVQLMLHVKAHLCFTFGEAQKHNFALPESTTVLHGKHICPSLLWKHSCAFMRDGKLNFTQKHTRLPIIKQKNL